MAAKLIEVTPQQWMEFSKEEAAKAVEQILAKFDFEKAAMSLFGCDWKWFGQTASPQAAELRKIAEELLKKVIKMGPDSSIQQGPICVRAHYYSETPEYVHVDLYLVPVQESAFFFDARPLIASAAKRMK